MSTPEEQKIETLVRTVNEVLARQTLLEERLARLERGSAPAEAVKPMEAPTVSEAPPAPVRPQLESKIGLTLINRVGVVTLLLGVGFFFKWAVDNHWIGPTGRVILGLFVGLAGLAIADVLWRKSQQVFAQGITGAGVAIVYISLYAAFDFYHLLPQAAAFLLLLATTILAATLALRYNAIAIAALGFFGAYLLPLLLSNGEDHPWFLIGYLLLINVAATALASLRRWVFLEVLSFVASTLIFGFWLGGHGHQAADRWPSMMGALALCAQRFRTSLPVLFLLTQALTTVAVTWNDGTQLWLNLLLVFLVAASGLAFSHIRKYPAIVPTAFASFWLVAGLHAHTPAAYMAIGTAGFLLFTGWAWWAENLDSAGLSVFALSGPAYYAFAYSHLERDDHRWLGLLALLVGAYYVAFGWLLSRGRQNLRLLSFGMAAAFLALAIPIQMQGFRVTMAWSVQAAALTWIGLRMKSSRALVVALLVFGLALAHVIVVEIWMYPVAQAYQLLWNPRFLTFLVLAATLLLAAYWMADVERRLALVPFIAGHLVMLAGLGLEVAGWANRSFEPANQLSAETIGITILFALYAMLLVGIGVGLRSAVHRVAGLVLTAVVILKLYIFDVWQLGRIFQIVAFVILGLLLLSTSFLYSRFKGFIEDWTQDEKKS